jgi:hypothetical protein
VKFHYDAGANVTTWSFGALLRSVCGSARRLGATLVAAGTSGRGRAQGGRVARDGWLRAQGQGRCDLGAGWASG